MRKRRIGMVQAEPRPAGHPAGRRERGGAAGSLTRSPWLAAGAPAQARLGSAGSGCGPGGSLLSGCVRRDSTSLPELPAAPCDQRARHWLPIIPAFAYSCGRGRGGAAGGALRVRAAAVTAPRPSAGFPAPRLRGRPAPLGAAGACGAAGAGRSLDPVSHR